MKQTRVQDYFRFPRVLPQRRKPMLPLLKSISFYDDLQKSIRVSKHKRVNQCIKKCSILPKQNQVLNNQSEAPKQRGRGETYSQI